MTTNPIPSNRTGRWNYWEEARAAARAAAADAYAGHVAREYERLVAEGREDDANALFDDAPAPAM